MGSDDTLGKVKDPLVALIGSIKRRSPREKLVLGCLAGLLVRHRLTMTLDFNPPLP